MREASKSRQQFVCRRPLSAGCAAGIVRQHQARRIVDRRPHPGSGDSLVQILVGQEQLPECRRELPPGQRVVLVELGLADDAPEIRVGFTLGFETFPDDAGGLLVEGAPSPRACVQRDIGGKAICGGVIDVVGADLLAKVLRLPIAGSHLLEIAPDPRAPPRGAVDERLALVRRSDQACPFHRRSDRDHLCEQLE